MRTVRLPAPCLGLLSAGLLLLLHCAAAAAAAEGPPARVAIVIDDLGNSLEEGRRVIALPAPVACAILPHTAYARTLAEAAYVAGKEVLLHLPMEAPAGQLEGPGRLDSQMPELEIAMTFEYDLTTVPHAVGVNNHMGSVLTSQVPPMRALMRAIARRGAERMFFLDSRTTPDSVAARAAAEAGVAYLKRDVFLDSDRSPMAVARSLARLEATARRRGRALAIGHPHPETLAALERWLPEAAARGITIVPPTALLAEKEDHDAERARSARSGL